MATPVAVTEREGVAKKVMPDLVQVGIVQMCSRNDKESNFLECEKLVAEAATAGCKLVAFPECFSFIGAKPGEAQIAAEPLTGPTMSRYCELAKKHEIWLSLGGFQELPASPEGSDAQAPKIYNAHVVIDSGGEMVAQYRKIHLFDAPCFNLVESNQTVGGAEVVSCDSPIGRLGVTICYDMRFPELYQNLRFTHGCEVMLIPAAFTVPTGQAHWESLLRARAIECQCYVIAAAQTGRHNEDGNRRESWGHSIVIDPWGKVLQDMGRDEMGLRVVALESSVLEDVRRRMPLDTHRRYDIYGPEATESAKKQSA
eukprot:CAMPEP_0206450038 /NCGR_PEP_ID=MMETSP0324_2-20121206/18468_1 /ASSEMBLY_ACC=CAM_ASM_000836 /TAXON_ID=2866 /ORGANISM="Crypthecodinium cohnii, Strain Seligo" /LENGTH=312 /DNA_ID=CAMNT_0053919573 /DNA_START=222 /DNA_END=1160 /DNA_ORIENTATION=-